MVCVVASQIEYVVGLLANRCTKSLETVCVVASSLLRCATYEIMYYAQCNEPGHLSFLVILSMRGSRCEEHVQTHTG